MYSSANELYRILKRLPDAVAVMSGAPNESDISGTVKFYQGNGAVLVVADIFGLPVSQNAPEDKIFAFHIHQGGCEDNGQEPFSQTGGHYNPNNCPHPYHSGDMPPLFSANGRAFSVFLTNRFSVSEVLGRSVVLHQGADDFSTQPSGAAGEKIGCGIITPTAR